MQWRILAVVNRCRRAVIAVVVAGFVVAGTAASANTTHPSLAAAHVIGDRVALTFDGPLQTGRGSWTAVVNGIPSKLTRTAVSGRRAQLVLPRPVFGDDTLRIIGRSLRSRTGARVPIVIATPVNRSPAGCTDEFGRVAPGQATEGPSDTAMFLGLGRPRIFVVNVDYADAPSRGPGGSRLDQLDFWLRSLSYGRSALEQVVHPNVVRMPKGYRDYARTGDWSARKTFFQDLVVRLDPEVDFAGIDAVVVYGTRASGVISVDPSVIAPSGGGLVADGQELRHFGELTSPTTSPLQMLLALAGLPSLRGALLGDWDPTASTLEPTRLGMLAWHRRKLGWLDPTQVRCLRKGSLEVTLTPTWAGGAGGVKMVVVPTSPRSAIVLENRQRVGLDAGHCTQGILVYDVKTDPIVAPIRLLPAVPPVPADPCGYQSRAPYDFRRGSSTNVAGISFEVLDVGSDGSFRLRVSRT